MTFLDLIHQTTQLSKLNSSPSDKQEGSEGLVAVLKKNVATWR